MDEIYMREALRIAAYASGRTTPNPLVGAVIVKDNRIVGQGWHRKAGTEHAEIHALHQAGELAKGADIYVTLEPCSHYGKTPPCCQAIIKAGIKRVIVAMTDPNPLVAGNGLKELKAAGIEVVEGVCRDEAEKLNEVFLKWIVHKMPFIVVKTAMTLDGKIATVSGDSKWITNEKSRKFVHQLRDLYDGILVGIGTVLADNPTLTTRLDHLGKNPVRIIVDSKARIPLDSIVITNKSAHTILAVTERASQEKIAALLQVGIEVIVTKEKADQVDLSDLLKILAEKNICSILVEGGSRINYSFFVEHLVDKVHCFIAPKIIGGTDAASPIGGKGTFYMKDAYQLNDITTERFDEDILITGYVR
ncbi:bifunctional diaminohydroxyphosphoribosylaminopyrimidine deaminase/5-amino-6-(5-phosphoribosylamino)uracil reductase RibD [Anaerosinus gibii]|uniref:Riboflavin biosynthesis protein RibD n=1 Tax=Selenobaculum gibii TaxID=3054208 RepID=A0A9Y2AK02_9FIRM|nr:bifunctional diaminohydroxyphosphoribosylaminopyrimidine deaminase/5-amino-6-(5-phosphoribosylamino)uracil reductase RibD [Selenobaculum gbiensis]WIW71847.1 bifunctional diaminohydroxyphosphoribosylaminopyrimidine deaminase/5-amino-6-(5-phosphoribosylamino)uracil reductase RibD [Selenobaculum gbiensis]